MARQKPPTSSASANQSRRFPIVGVGASAGGFDALRRLLKAMPEQPNMAIVVVHHLAPDKPSLAPELLSKYTNMDVCEANDDSLVQPNCLYIIPPGNLLQISAGRLKLKRIDGARTVPVVIDSFFSSLANDQAECAMAVVLSGTGSDGTVGVKAIKEAGGFIIAQDPATAEYDGMPISVIETGLVDQILSPEQIPETLMQFASHSYIRDASESIEPQQNLGTEVSVSGEDAASPESNDVESILELLRKHEHQDFRNYKPATLIRRTRRRMCLHHLDRFEDYAAYLEDHPDEIDALAKDMLISVTNFFRDPEAWEELADKVLADVVSSKTDVPHPIEADESERSVRVWVPGCATGEEAYGVAMLVMDEILEQGKTCAVHVFASDIDAKALHKARQGRYPRRIEADVSSERLSRYFTYDENESHYQVSKQLREAVVFADQDLISDPPFSNLDLICCRNLMIYLNSETQEKVISLFHFALRQQGYLMLGTAETVGRQEQLFETVNKPWRIYQSRDSSEGDFMNLPISRRSWRREFVQMQPLPPKQDLRMTQIAQLKLLDMVSPRAVMISRDGRILYISGDVDPYLRVVSGAPNDDFFAKLRGRLHSRLRGVIHQVFENQKPIAVKCQVDPQSDFEVRVEIHLIPDSEKNEDFALIVFRDTDDPNSELAATDRQSDKIQALELSASDTSDESLIKRLEYELESAREELQASIERCRISDEEYRASNEEVRSINEELQSANEELETSKEEMQSFNEELTTVNQQLALKIEELEAKHADLENLIAATDVATICLDEDLAIRWFTPAAQKVSRIRRSDFGRPLSELAHDLSEGDFEAGCLKVLAERTPIEDEVTCKDGRAFIRRVAPSYRDKNVSGVVVTMLDVTLQKSREKALRQSEERFRQSLNIEGIGVTFYDSDKTLIDCNDWFLEATGYSREEVQSKSITRTQLTPPEWTELTLQQMDIMEKTGRAGPYEKEYFRKDGSRLCLMLSGCKLLDDTIVMHCIDIGERMRFEQELHQSNQVLEEQVQQRTSLLANLSVLQDVTRVANQARTVEEAMQAALDRIAERNDWPIGHWWQVAEDESGHLVSSRRWHVKSDVAKRVEAFCLRTEQSRLEPNKELVGMALKSGEPQWITEEKNEFDHSRYEEIGMHAVVAIPILIGKETVAVLEFLSDEDTYPEHTFVDVLTDISIQLGYITARKRLEKIVANIAIAEQHRIGRELHDGIAQQLTGGSLIAASLRRNLTPEMTTLAEQADYLIDILKQTHQDVRSLCSGLMPHEIEASDLLPTLRGLAAETRDRFKIDCVVEEDGFDESTVTSDSVAFVVYQIAREAVHNAVKYANASRIAIELSDNDEFDMTIRDDGVGIPADYPNSESNGLRIMRYRAESVEGQLKIESSVGGGTQIKLIIPKQNCQS